MLLVHFMILQESRVEALQAIALSTFLNTVISCFNKTLIHEHSCALYVM